MDPLGGALPLDHIDAVLLDSGGVLMLPDPGPMGAALASLGGGGDAETCRRAHYASMREVDRLGEADWAAVDRALARAAGVPDDRLDDAIPLLDEVYLRQPWVPIDGVAEALVELQRAGYALAVVSNASGTMEEMLATHRICSVGGTEHASVAIVVDSDVVGVEKPDPKIFSFALDALGVPPERCIYVGDTVHFDVNGSRAAGLHPVHVDPYRFCPGDDHVHVGSVVELTAVLVAARS